jgi:hypothetical protein
MLTAFNEKRSNMILNVKQLSVLIVYDDVTAMRKTLLFE